MASITRVGSGPYPHEHWKLTTDSRRHDLQAVVDAAVTILRNSSIDPESYTIHVHDLAGENWPCPSDRLDTDFAGEDDEC